MVQVAIQCIDTKRSESSAQSIKTLLFLIEQRLKDHKIISLPVNFQHLISYKSNVQSNCKSGIFFTALEVCCEEEIRKLFSLNTITIKTTIVTVKYTKNKEREKTLRLHPTCPQLSCWMDSTPWNWIHFLGRNPDKVNGLKKILLTYIRRKHPLRFSDKESVIHSYRVDTEAVCVSDAEGVVFVCEDDDVRYRVDSQGKVIGPEYRTDIQRQWSQVTLG